MILSIVEIKSDAPKTVKDALARVVPGSVLVADEKSDGKSDVVVVDFEGGVYTRKDRSPTQDEKNEYAKIAAGRSSSRYPTVARICLPSMEGLREIGSVNTETWEVTWYVAVRD